MRAASPVQRSSLPLWHWLSNRTRATRPRCVRGSRQRSSVRRFGWSSRRRLRITSAWSRPWRTKRIATTTALARRCTDRGWSGSSDMATVCAEAGWGCDVASTANFRNLPAGVRPEAHQRRRPVHSCGRARRRVASAAERAGLLLRFARVRVRPSGCGGRTTSGRGCAGGYGCTRKAISATTCGPPPGRAGRGGVRQRRRPRRPEGALVSERRPDRAADEAVAGAPRRAGHDQAPCGDRGAAGVDLLPHVPGDGDHGQIGEPVTVEVVRDHDRVVPRSSRRPARVRAGSYRPPR